jgi:hypothetical protein
MIARYEHQRGRLEPLPGFLPSLAMAWLAHGCPRIALALLLLAACKDDPPPASDETGSSTGGSSSSTGNDPSATSGMTTAPPPMTTDPDSTTFGAGCGLDPCAEKCGLECENTATCIASVWMCECDCPTTSTTGDQCPTLDDAIETWVDPSKTPAIDCGSVGPDDDLFAWETLHDCVLIQVVGSAMRATWALAVGADPVQYGEAARVGAAYELAWYEISGTSTLTQYACDTIVATPDCIVEVGVACLTCEGQTEVEILCEDVR